MGRRGKDRGLESDWELLPERAGIRDAPGWDQTGNSLPARAGVRDAPAWPRCPGSMPSTSPPADPWAAEAAGSMRGEGITAADARLLRLPSQQSPAVRTPGDCQLILLQPKAGGSPAAVNLLFPGSGMLQFPGTTGLGILKPPKGQGKAGWVDLGAFPLLHHLHLLLTSVHPTPRGAPGTRQAERIQTFPINQFLLNEAPCSCRLREWDFHQSRPDELLVTQHL